MTKSTNALSARNRSVRWFGIVTMFTLVGAGWTGIACAADPKHGGEIYGQQCINCHGPRGQPTMPGTPDFSRGERLMQSDIDLIKTISRGKGMMPAYQGILTERDIFDVIAYLRTLR